MTDTPAPAIGTVLYPVSNLATAKSAYAALLGTIAAWRETPWGTVG